MEQISENERFYCARCYFYHRPYTDGAGTRPAPFVDAVGVRKCGCGLACGFADVCENFITQEDYDRIDWPKQSAGETSTDSLDGFMKL